MKCQNVKVSGDTSCCLTCGNLWDTNDFDPPECKRLPIYNTVRHNPPETYGDCVRACIQTMIGGKPPHFFHDGCDGIEGRNRINEWLKPQGLVLTLVFMSGSLSLDQILNDWGSVNPETPAILFGRTAIADHAVCIRGSEIIHNPDVGRSRIVASHSSGFWMIATIVKK